MAKRKKKAKKNASKGSEVLVPSTDERGTVGPDFGDGPEFDGYEGRTAVESESPGFAESDGYEERAAETEQPAFAEDEVASVAPTDDDGYIIPPESIPEGVVVVQDYDPADPGAPIAEPQKVLKPHDRIARKRARGSRE